MWLTQDIPVNLASPLLLLKGIQLSIILTRPLLPHPQVVQNLLVLSTELLREITIPLLGLSQGTYLKENSPPCNLPTIAMFIVGWQMFGNIFRCQFYFESVSGWDVHVSHIAAGTPLNSNLCVVF